MNTRRMQYIDMAKGIGILLVIIGHTMSLGWKKDFIYSFHMPLFFCLQWYDVAVLFDLGGMEKSDQKIGETLAAPNRCAVSIYVLVGRCNSRYYLEWTNKRAY